MRKTTIKRFWLYDETRKNYTASKISEADTCSDLNTDSRFPEGKHQNRSNIMTESFMDTGNKT